MIIIIQRMEIIKKWILNLEEYLNIKGIKLESLVLGEVLGEKSLEESR